MEIRFTKEDIDFAIIIDYFEGNLSSSQNRKIDDYIDEDEEFAEWVNDAHEGWLRDQNQFKENVIAFHKQMDHGLKEIKAQNKENSSLKRKGILQLNPPKSILYPSIAAVIVFLLAFGYLLQQSDPNQFDNCELSDIQCIVAKDMQSPYKNSLKPHGGGLKDSIEHAIELYRAEDYPNAISEIQTLLGKEVNPFYMDELKLCLGVSLTMTNNFDEAQPYLLSLTTSDAMAYQLEANWYLALIALQQKDFSKAREYLHKTNAHGEHVKSSQELLDLLKGK